MGFYDDGVDLGDLLWSTIENYSDDRDATWRQLEAEDLLKLVDTIAKKLVEGAGDLTIPAKPDGSPASWDSLLELLSNDDAIHQALLEHVQLSVAYEYSTGVEGMAERCLELASLLISTPQSESVVRYLRRLSRCYIAGFRPECVILCRAVLENAVGDTFRRKHVPLPATEEGRSSMRQHLDAAQTLGWLSFDGRHAAWVVWQRGNRAAHNDPWVTGQVLDTIRMTLDVVQELSAA